VCVLMLVIGHAMFIIYLPAILPLLINQNFAFTAVIIIVVSSVSLIKNSEI
jgi:hypothetical protein